jgi:hypothetical protein
METHFNTVFPKIWIFFFVKPGFINYNVCTVSAKKACYTHDIISETFEKTLMIWIEANTLKRIPLDGNIIKQKAVKIYEHLKITKFPEGQHKFSASNGWFEKFKNR